MKHRLIFLPVFLCVLFINIETVFAINTGYSTETLSPSEENRFRSNIEITLLQDEPKKRPIVLFDVSETGQIAICSENFSTKYVCVYSTDGNFQYGYSFDCDGSIGIEWDGNNILILLVRSGLIVSVNPSGTIETILRVPSTTENSVYEIKTHSPKRLVGDTEYIIKNDLGILSRFGNSYSRLIAKEADGTETIIYDVNSEQLVRAIMICIFMLAFITITLVKLRLELKKLRKQS